MADQLTLYQLGELIMPPDFQTFRHPCQVLDTRGYKVQRIREFDLDQTVRFQERVGEGTFIFSHKKNLKNTDKTLHCVAKI